jgi:hypothetical protein
VSKRSKRRQGGHAPEGAEAGGRAASGRAAPRDAGGRAAQRAAASSRAGSGRAAPREAADGAPPAPSAASGWGLGVQLAFLVAVFAVVVLVAELAGAANLGVALGVGQIAFAIAVIYLLVRR